MEDSDARNRLLTAALRRAKCEGFAAGSGGRTKERANPYPLWNRRDAFDYGCAVYWRLGFREGRRVFHRRLRDARRAGLRAGHGYGSLADNPYDRSSDDWPERACAITWMGNFLIGRHKCFELSHQKITAPRRSWNCLRIRR